MRVLGAKLVVGAGAILLLAAAPALARPVGACNVHRAHATRVTPKVIVYGKRRGYDAYGSAETVYYACARPAGKSITIGTSSSDNGEYPGNYAVSMLRVAGTYVGAVLGSGYADAAACGKYDPANPNCAKAIHSSVRLVATRAGGWFQTRISGATALAVSPAGALAWVQPSDSQGSSQLEALVIHRPARDVLASAQELIDTGAIGASLRFSGPTLFWTNSGQPKSRRLR